MKKIKKQVMVIETLTYYVNLETEIEDDENEEDVDWGDVVIEQMIPDQPMTHINEDLDINVVEVDDNG